MSYPLVRAAAAARLDLNTFAHATGLHPDLVRRLLTLGLVEFVADSGGNPWFPIEQVTAVARIQRLRAGFALNYAAVGLVVDLLDRIAYLEAKATLQKRPIGG